MPRDSSAGLLRTGLGDRDELVGEEARIQAPDCIRSAVEQVGVAGHGNREVDPLDAVTRLLERLTQRRAREEVGVRAVEDPPVRVAPPPGEEREADGPV